MDWSVRDLARRVVGRSKKRGKQSGTRTATVQTAAERVRQKDPPDWSIRGGMKHGASPRTGWSRGAPGAMDWSVRGNGESTINKGAPDWSIRGGRKQGTSPRTGPSGGEPGATDWTVRGSGENMTEHPTRRAREQRG